MKEVITLDLFDAVEGYLQARFKAAGLTYQVAQVTPIEGSGHVRVELLKPAEQGLRTLDELIASQGGGGAPAQPPVPPPVEEAWLRALDDADEEVVAPAVELEASATREDPHKHARWRQPRPKPRGADRMRSE